MGCVYEAEQDNPRRRVALKVLRTGALSEQVLQRFQREAQILGRLHHPGIAQVLEAGTFGPPGRPSRVQPYFAMEFIEGEPLTKFAADARLDVRGRLKLIAKICDAVQHAHDRGVITATSSPPTSWWCVRAGAMRIHRRSPRCSISAWRGRRTATSS
jgi:non-specific serine/threonine protein kinase/serine/threonine-protein kinase